jgi:hypothetical protein
VAIRSNDMTYLAFRLALEKKLVFLATPTFRKRYSSDSISRTDEWTLASLGTLDKMSTFAMPAPVRRRLRRKCTLTAHEISNIHRQRGELGPAWRFHLRSLIEPWGLWNYSLYTRRLLFARNGQRQTRRSRSPSGESRNTPPQAVVSEDLVLRKTDNATGP